MRSKAPLALMEQAVMILVFALAAVLCLRMFVWSDTASERGADRDMAVLRVQSAAELIKSEGKSGFGEEEALKAVSSLLGGSYTDGEGFTVGYGSDWNAAEGDAEYVLKASPKNSETKGLAEAVVGVYGTDGEALFEITVAWQKGAD